MNEVIQKLRGIHSKIADDVYPDGWSGNCRKCGKPFHYTKDECVYYLARGWPKCDCRRKVDIAVSAGSES